MDVIEVDLRHMQYVDLGDKIRIKIMHIERGRCRIGIDAPREIKVLRGELVGGVCVAGRGIATDQADVG